MFVIFLVKDKLNLLPFKSHSSQKSMHVILIKI